MRFVPGRPGSCHFDDRTMMYEGHEAQGHRHWADERGRRRALAMTYEGVSFDTRPEWTLLNRYPARAEPSVSQATGSRDDAIAAPHSTDWSLGQEATQEGGRIFSMIRTACRHGPSADRPELLLQRR